LHHPDGMTTRITAAMKPSRFAWARPGRKRNEDGGVPLDRPDWPLCSKRSDKGERRFALEGSSLERR